MLSTSFSLLLPLPPLLLLLVNPTCMHFKPRDASWPKPCGSHARYVKLKHQRAGAAAACTINVAYLHASQGCQLVEAMLQ
jgi:hypothetical protein